MLSSQERCWSSVQIGPSFVLFFRALLFLEVLEWHLGLVWAVSKGDAITTTANM